jgi:choline dehydrogenase-like flavoprotein
LRRERGSARHLTEPRRDHAQAAGALKVWPEPVAPQTNSVHMLGTCRMGNDPKSSVVDRFHRAHVVRNLFICDGSSLVTSPRGHGHRERHGDATRSLPRQSLSSTARD